MTLDGASLLEVALGLLAVTAGALVQGSVGFGFGFVVVPTLGLIRPHAVPATVLLLALPMTISVALRERGAIDLPGFWWMTAGRVAGTAGGVALLVAVPAPSLSVLTGTIMIVAVLLATITPDFEAGRPSRLTAGVVSGIMGTAAAIGGPPAALVYQDHPRRGAEVRSTLNLTFVAGGVMSIVGLLLSGRISGSHAVLAVWLLPGLVLGLWLSVRASRWLEGGWLRPAVYAFAGVAGAVVFVRGLLG